MEVGARGSRGDFFCGGVGWGGRGLNLICICDLGINSVVIVYAVRPP